MSTLSHGDPEREGLGLSPLSLGRGCRRAAGEGRAPAQSLISATVRARVPRGTASRTNGTRPRPAWDSSVYQWYAPVSRAGQPHVPTVRARVPRGTAPCTNGTRPRLTRDSLTYQRYAPASHVGQPYVPMVRAPVPRGTVARRNGSRRRPAWDSTTHQWFALAFRAGRQHISVRRRVSVVGRRSRREEMERGRLARAPRFERSYGY